MSFGRATGENWHATRKLVLRNLSSRSPSGSRADRRDRGGARGLVFAFAPARMRGSRPDGIARSTSPSARCTDGRAADRGPVPRAARGSNVDPHSVAGHGGGRAATRCSRRSSCRRSSFRPVGPRTGGALVPGRANRERAGRSSRSRRSMLHLRRSDGSKLGVLAQLRDLLPGRYAFGLTGRDARRRLRSSPGRYRSGLTAYPTGQGPPSKAIVVVHHSVTRAHRLILAAEDSSSHLQPKTRSDFVTTVAAPVSHLRENPFEIAQQQLHRVGEIRSRSIRT